MSSIKKNSQVTNSKETADKKKRIPLRVLIPVFFTCFCRQLKRYLFTPNQNEVTEGKEKASKPLKILFTIAVIIFVIVILLKGCSNTYYTSSGTYQKIEADANQEAMDDETTTASNTETEIDFDNHVFDNSVTLYSCGDVATSINNKVKVDVANVKESTANMVLEIYIPDDELNSKIGTNGRIKSSQKEIDAKVKAAQEDGSSYSPAVCVAKSGLIYPGNKITTLNLKTLENGTVLPAGEYSAYYKETFYDDNGNLHSVDASLAITLVVQ